MSRRRAAAFCLRRTLKMKVPETRHARRMARTLRKPVGGPAGEVNVERTAR
jgi:hypothetical protein